MRVLLISDGYFPRINGVSTSIETFSRELKALGHAVDLIAPAYPGANDDEPGIMRIRSRYLFFDPEDRMLVRREIHKRIPALRHRGYDIVHIHTPFVAHYAGLKIAADLGAPVVESYHTYFEEYLSHYIPWLPKRWLRYCARRFSRGQCNSVDAVIVPSTPMKKVLERYGVRTPMHLIPTGLDMRQFEAGDGGLFRQRHGIPAERPLLVHAGRLAHEKNIDFLLYVLREVRKTIPDVLLAIAGDGPARFHLESLVAELGLGENTLFTGYLDRGAELLDCYRAGEAFVFASRTETQGLVLLEAMAVGTPVISTAQMGAAEIMAASQGAIVAEDDLSDFSNKVVRLLKDTALRARLSVAARKHIADSWSASAMAARLENLYLSLRNQPQ